MIRRMVNWLLYKLHLKKKKEIDAFEALVGLIPVLLSLMMLVKLHNSLFGEIRVLWYTRLWMEAKVFVRRFRTIVIGY